MTKNTTKKRGQLSVETMIIYGLAILVTLSVIAGLIYFNIFNIASYLPDSCALGGSGDLKCEEMRFSATGSGGEIALGIRNTGSRPIESLTIFATDSESVHFTSTPSGSGYIGTDLISATNSLAAGEIATVTIATDGINSGQTLQGVLRTEYKFKDGAITQESTGSIRIKAS